MADSYVVQCIGDNSSIPVIRATYNQTYSWNIPGTPPFLIGRSISRPAANSTFSNTYCDNPANVTGNFYDFTIEPLDWLSMDPSNFSRNSTTGLLLLGDSIVFTAISMASGPTIDPMYAVSSNYSIVNTTQSTNDAASTKSKSLVGLLLGTALVSLVSL